MTKRKKAKTKKPKTKAVTPVAAAAEEAVSPEGVESAELEGIEQGEPTVEGAHASGEAGAAAEANEEVGAAPVDDASAEEGSTAESSDEAPENEKAPENEEEGRASASEDSPVESEPAATARTSDLELILDDEPSDEAGESGEPGDDGGKDAGDTNAASDQVQKDHLRGLVEALVFASDSPISARDVARHASAPVKKVREVLAQLHQEYQARGIHLDEVAGGWTFRTSVQYAPFVRDLTKQKPVKLTRAQVESLAIIAYRQPITRPEIDEVRGVDSGPVLKVLLERDLVRILGKRDEPGRPLIYGTTATFLEFFGLRSLKDLPTLREFTELTDESLKTYEDELGEPVTERTGEESPEASPAEGEGAAEGEVTEAIEVIEGGGDEDGEDEAGDAEAVASEEPADPENESEVANEIAELIAETSFDSEEEREEIEELIDPGEDLDERALEELENTDEAELEALGQEALDELERDSAASLDE